MNDLDKAVKVLKEGGILIFPTDTAFGIGCRVDSKDTIKRLFRIRRRPENKATPVLVSSLEMAREYAEIGKDVEEKLANRYWPGGLTIVVKAKKEKVPPLVRGNGENIGLRVPDHEDLLNVIRRLGVGILGPSANFHQGNTPYKLEDLDSELIKNVDFVLPGETKGKKASTVIDTTSNPWKILREGEIKLEY